MEKFFGLNLNEFWHSISIFITNISFIGSLKIIFFIFFVLLNIGLLYYEYLENKNKEKQGSETHTYKHAGPGHTMEYKRIATNFFAAVGLLSSYITIKNEIIRTAKEAEYKEVIANTAKAVKKISNEQSKNNFLQKMHFERINGTYDGVSKILTEKSELVKSIEENNASFELTGKSIYKETVRLQEMQLALLNLEQHRKMTELGEDILSGSKFSEAISQETDENKILALINEDDIKKSSILEIDDIWA